MAEHSKIEWCTHTFNPWVGCTKVSCACDGCYAEAWAKRTGYPELWHGERRRTKTWAEPRKWDRRAAEAGRCDRVFCASLADAFDNQVYSRWRDDLWHLIAQTPNLIWMLLTKRPQNIAKMLPSPMIGAPEWGNGWPNVWLGTTVEDQEEANRRIPHLLSVPARVHFLSCEPLLEHIDLFKVWDSPKFYFNALSSKLGISFNGRRIDLVICGGETGSRPSPTTDGPRLPPRPMHPAWARSLRDQCATAGVPFFFKQWGDWDADALLFTDLEGRCPPPKMKIGKKRAGRLLDGVEHNGMPELVTA